MGSVVSGLANTVTGYAGDPLGQGANQRAIGAQTQETNQANQVIGGVYGQQQAALQPYQQAGLSGLAGMQDPSFQQSFTMNDFQKDPGYDFRMQQGQQALERSAASRGGLQSGATLKALTQYGQNFASNEYQNAYNRFTQDQNTRFSRLSSLAGIGQNATGQLVNAGGQYGNSMSNNLTGLGNAIAGANIAQGQENSALTGGLIGLAARGTR